MCYWPMSFKNPVAKCGDGGTNTCAALAHEVETRTRNTARSSVYSVINHRFAGVSTLTDKR